MKDYQKRGLIAVAMVLLGFATVVVLNSLIADEFMKARIIGFDAENDAYLTSMQTIMWVAFFVALGELFYRLLHVLTIEKSLQQSYLPDDGYTIIELDDLPSIAKKIEKDAQTNGTLASFIKKLLMQFQTSNSIEQTLNMLNAQLEMRSSLIDLHYNMVRYLSWFIPTLGFIGTVVGIASALKYAGDVNGQGATFVADLTAKLAVAFDTTLVALMMSAVIVFLMHIIQGREESDLVESGQYCLDNFINRLYIEQGE